MVMIKNPTYTGLPDEVPTEPVPQNDTNDPPDVTPEPPAAPLAEEAPPAPAPEETE